MNGESEQPMSVPAAAAAPAERGLQRAWAIARSTFHWLLSAAYFFPVCSFLVLLGFSSIPARTMARSACFAASIMKLAGAKLVVRRAPGFDPGTHLLSPCQSCQSVRSVRALRHDSAILPGTGARIALSHSRVRLDDETLRQRSRAGQQSSVGPETHVAADARRARRRA